MIVRKYELLEKLGEGGMGVVWKARDTELGRIVAVKMIHQRLALERDIRKRFIDEARIQAKLVHQNICTLFDAFDEGGKLFLVQEFVNGMTLKKTIEEAGGPLPVERVIKLAIGILDGLAHAHEENVVHRDIKPSNIMVDGRGRVKIMDFGIAKALGAERMGKTKTGVTLGTPEYMSPEQILGKDVDARSDIYSFGITLYEMITGKLPFDRTSSEFEIQRFHIERAVPPLESQDGAATILNRVIAISTAKEPSQRAHAGQLRDTLHDMIASDVPRTGNDVVAPCECPYPPLESAYESDQAQLFSSLITELSQNHWDETQADQLLRWCATISLPYRALCLPLLHTMLGSPMKKAGRLSRIKNLFSNTSKMQPFLPASVRARAASFFYLDMKYEDACVAVLTKMSRQHARSRIVRDVFKRIMKERRERQDAVAALKRRRLIVAAIVCPCCILAVWLLVVLILVDLMRSIDTAVVASLVVLIPIALIAFIVFRVITKESRILRIVHAQRLHLFAKHIPLPEND